MEMRLLKKASAICLAAALVIGMIPSVVGYKGEGWIVEAEAEAAEQEITITYDPGTRSFGGNPHYDNPGISADGKLHKTVNEGDEIAVCCSWYWAASDDGKYYATGWKLKGDKTGHVYKHGDSFTVPGKNITFVADWHKKCVVTYDYNGGGQETLERYEPYTYNCAENSKYIVYERDYNLNSTGFNGKYVLRKGYTFKGWKVKGSSDGKLYQHGDTYNLKKNTTFVAVWEKKKASNPLKIKVKTKTFKRAKLKKKKVFSIGVSKAQGKVKYILNAAAKKAKVTVNAKGKVTVPKKCKKGTYKITVKATGNKNYKTASKTVTIKVK